MHIVDNEGHVVMTLRSKSFSAHNKWYIYAGNSTDKEDKIATVKPHESSISAEVWPMLQQLSQWTHLMPFHQQHSDSLRPL